MSTYHILIIEDDPAIGQSLLDGFKHHGFEPDLCTTGTSGMEFVKKYSPHLILLDIRLPDGSGFDYCRQMRQAGYKQPIVMLTAQHDEVDTVNVHIRRLREKIELNPEEPAIILTVPGIGYRLVG